MDFNGFMQIVQTLIIGTLGWIVKRYIDKNDQAIADNNKKIDDTIAKFDDKTSKAISNLNENINGAIAKLDRKIEDVDKKHGDLQKEFQSLKAEMPLVYTLREDFVRVMNGVDDKLNKILYNRSGGNSSE